ncbi:MAG: hypothetical protein ACE361_07035 [Aureliella sp.]
MNWKRFCNAVVILLVASSLQGCGSGRPQPLTLEQLEQILSVSFPDDCEIIGGTMTENNASLCLITSSEPLPLPIEPDTKRKRKRPQGDPFPISALLNLIAASKVSTDDLPSLKDESGRSHQGEVAGQAFSYREAKTEQGWLTAIEVFVASD